MKVTDNKFFKTIKQLRALSPIDDKEVFRFMVQYEMFKVLVCYTHPMTMKQMCEHIVKAGFSLPNGQVPTAEEIFNYNPSGELSKIFDWYEDACALIGPPSTPQHS